MSLQQIFAKMIPMYACFPLALRQDLAIQLRLASLFNCWNEYMSYHHWSLTDNLMAASYKIYLSHGWVSTHEKETKLWAEKYRSLRNQDRTELEATLLELTLTVERGSIEAAGGENSMVLPSYRPCIYKANVPSKICLLAAQLFGR